MSEKESTVKQDNGYTGAPYNFVPVAKQVAQRYAEPGKLPRQNELSSSLHSGEIHCEVEAITDLLIGGGTAAEKECRFYQTAEGRYAIPGSSMKGLIRSNMQVLGFGSLAGDVEDYSIMYRMVGAKKSELQGYYADTVLDVKTVLLDAKNKKSVTVPRNVKAGYITQKNGVYCIYKTKKQQIDKKNFGEMNYYPVYEPAVMRSMEQDRKTFPAMYKNGVSIMQHTGRADDFTSMNKNGRVHIVGKSNESYVPYQKPVYYKLKDIRRVQSIIPAEGECPIGFEKGYVISTGKMKEKKTFYVIPEISSEDADAIDIPEKDVESFRHDYENKKNQLHGTLKDEKLKAACRKFFDLPERDEIKPVFYIEHGGRLYFGYTPFLRIFYKHSVLDGLSEDQRKWMDRNGKAKEAVLDYASAILGYSTDTSSYRSRVFFSDMKLQGNAEPDSVGRTMVLGEPKMSSYWDYLKQTKKPGASTYNDDGFELRGVKQYWLHKKAVPGIITNNSGAESTLYPLKAGCKFTGVIRFQNLAEDELGLLLWSLSLEANSNQNIGHAKPMGYGRIQISVKQLKEYNYQKMYAFDALAYGKDLYDVKKAEEVNSYINAYKEHMGGAEYMKSETIRSFLCMKNTERIPAEERIRYMSIDKNEYRNRELPLPTAQEVCSDKFYKEHPGYGIQVAEKKKEAAALEDNPKNLKLNQVYNAVVEKADSRNIAIKIGDHKGSIRNPGPLALTMSEGKKIQVKCIALEDKKNKKNKGNVFEVI